MYCHLYYSEYLLNPITFSILILTHMPLIYNAPKYPLALDQTPFPTGLPSPDVVVHPLICSVF